MYSVIGITNGEEVTIYNDMHLAENIKAISPKLTLKDNAAGALEITLPPGNAGYDILELMVSEIIVYRDEVEVWSGRIITEKKDFLNNRVLTCEGELAYLNDTTQPPDTFDGTVREFLEAVLAVHNSKSTKKFSVGMLDYIGGTINDGVRTTNDESSMDAIVNNLLTPLGGHLRIRKENGERYLDYFGDFPNVSDQTIRFGENLLDFTQGWNMTDIVTVVVPRGAEDDGVYLDVSSVNIVIDELGNEQADGSRYVTTKIVVDELGNEQVVSNQDAIDVYGRIERTIDWSDEKSPEELLKKAQRYLGQIMFDDLTIEVSAVDLRYLGVDVSGINVLDKIWCVSPPHGLREYLPVIELSIQLDKPDNSTYTLGNNTIGTLTASQKTIDQDIRHRIENIPIVDEDSVLLSARTNAQQLIDVATTGHITIQTSNEMSDALIISKEPWNTNPTRYWKWTSGGLGYFNLNESALPFVALTEDGAIVADRITAGNLNIANDLTVSGTIQSPIVSKTTYAYGAYVDGVWRPGNDVTRDTRNVMFDVSHGRLTIEEGEIKLGTTHKWDHEKSEWVYEGGKFSVDSDGQLYAEYGKIGGFTITSWSIYNDTLNLDSRGLDMTSGTTNIGHFGVNNWDEWPSKKGLVMDLENESDYMGWFYRTTSSSSTYDLKLAYIATTVGYDEETMYADTLVAGCELDMRGNNLRAPNLVDQRYNGNYGYSGDLIMITKWVGGVPTEAHRGTFTNGILTKLY